MVWAAEGSQGFESRKIAAFIVPYTRGRGLDLGCGMEKAWPHMIGVDSGHHFGQGGIGDIDAVGERSRADLLQFRDRKLGFLPAAHRLDDFLLTADHRQGRRFL